jgi:hypothetical protein
VYEIIWIAFIKNNVLIIVHAPQKTAKVFALEIDKTIQNAPEWKKDTLKRIPSTNPV